MTNSYYRSSYQRISIEELLSYFKDLKNDQIFKQYVEMDEGFEKLFVERIRELSGVISTFASLSAQHESDIFSSGAYDTYELNEFSEVEAKFINRFSIMYRYFRFKFDKLNTDRIIADGLIADYAAMCILVGMAAAHVNKNTSSGLSSGEVEKLYQAVIFSFTGYYRFSSEVKRIFKHLENTIEAASLRGAHSPLSFSFMQKAAIKQHGYQYIQLGNAIGTVRNSL